MCFFGTVAIYSVLTLRNAHDPLYLHCIVAMRGEMRQKKSFAVFVLS
jgi:hypothetical protein